MRSFAEEEIARCTISAGAGPMFEPFFTCCRQRLQLDHSCASQ